MMAGVCMYVRNVRRLERSPLNTVGELPSSGSKPAKHPLSASQPSSRAGKTNVVSIHTIHTHPKHTLSLLLSGRRMHHHHHACHIRAMQDSP
jgi:hypothetical protein